MSLDMLTPRPTIFAIVVFVSVVMSGCVTPRPTLDGEDFSHDHASIQAWSTDSKHPIIERATPDVWSEPPRSQRNHHANIVEFAFRFYSNYITKIDGARCEHRPTCSRYSLDAVRKHGMVLGSMLTIDRLLRGPQSSSLRGLPVLKYHEGQPYFSDPVEENDFFF